jgi:hypothetical protein
LATGRRLEARLGQIKTVEGLPKLELEQVSAVSEDEADQARFYCTLGDVKFQTSSRINNAIFEAIPHRAYFREGDAGALAALELA